jgi:Ca-activated chloride channel family protein
MFLGRLLAKIAIGLSVFFAIPSTVSAATNMLFIIDGSNSMWGQVDRVAKIKTAKKVLGRLLSDLPNDTKVGLMAYGHRAKGDCKDVETLSGIGRDSLAAVNAKVQALTPVGKTPIAYSLRQSAGTFAGLEKANNHVVLISDGIESCGGDPCAEAAKLVTKGIDVKVHVVGFDVDREARAQLECIAKKGKGRYFDAANTKSFKVALSEVKQVAQAAPKQVATGVYFRDDFNGSELAKHWEVINPNTDAFIVEDGNLLVVGSSIAALDNAKSENIFRLKKPMPKGNWVVTMKFSYQYQTGREIPYLAIYDSEKNYVASFAYSWSYYGGTRGSRMWMAGHKMSKGKKKDFSKVIWGGASGKPFTADQPPNPILVRLTKRGRSYIPAVKLLGGKSPKWVEHDKFTILRQKGGLAFGIYQGQKTTNETTMNVDWIKIEVTEN